MIYESAKWAIFLIQNGDCNTFQLSFDVKRQDGNT